MAKKEVKKEELENANGGHSYVYRRCPHCGEDTNICAAEFRTVGSGCDSYSESKCEHCGKWFRV